MYPHLMYDYLNENDSNKFVLVSQKSKKETM